MACRGRTIDKRMSADTIISGQGVVKRVGIDHGTRWRNVHTCSVG
jgi:hypothetical protein